MPEIRAELVLHGRHAKANFRALEAQKESIHQALGFELTWRNPNDAVMCRLSTRLDTEFLDRQLWPQHFNWLRERQEIMHKVLVPLIKNLRTEKSE